MEQRGGEGSEESPVFAGIRWDPVDIDVTLILLNTEPLVSIKTDGASPWTLPHPATRRRLGRSFGDVVDLYSHSGLQTAKTDRSTVSQTIVGWPKRR